jgi:hypothetical protein
MHRLVTFAFFCTRFVVLLYICTVGERIHEGSNVPKDNSVVSVWALGAGKDPTTEAESQREAVI